jgi:hypothetical protein
LALRPAHELDAVQHLPLKGGPQALHRRDPLVTARLFEFLDARDAELSMKLHNFIRRESWNPR